MCICIYIIISIRIVIDGGPPPELFLVIFIQNAAILGNSNGYTCLDIMPQQEGRLPIYLIRDIQYIVIYINLIHIVIVSIKSRIRVHNYFRIECERSDMEKLFENETDASEASRNFFEKMSRFP